MKSSFPSVQAVFDRYEDLRPRLPKCPAGPVGQDIGSLLDVSDQIDAFVFDAYGVLNLGDSLIPGADQRLSELREAGCAIRVLSNAASYPRAGVIAKFRRLGLELDPAEIITSRDVIYDALDDRLWGAIAADEDDLSDLPAQTLRLSDNSDDYDRVDGFVFLSTANWSETCQEVLERSLEQAPRPVIIANADLVAPRETWLSVEPGYFGHQLMDLGHHDVRFFGKPYPEVFELAARSLPGLEKSRIAMCGDTLHTDILGAAAFGWRTVLVARDGLFAGHDTAPFVATSEIRADWVTPRI